MTVMFVCMIQHYVLNFHAAVYKVWTCISSSSDHPDLPDGYQLLDILVQQTLLTTLHLHLGGQHLELSEKKKKKEDFFMSRAKLNGPVNSFSVMSSHLLHTQRKQKDRKEDTIIHQRYCKHNRHLPNSQTAEGYYKSVNKNIK